MMNNPYAELVARKRAKSESRESLARKFAERLEAREAKFKEQSNNLLPKNEDRLRCYNL